jgi:ribosome-associated heat shock protein Hsp15
MLIDNHVRVDKWLWAVRIYKTRNLATHACRKGRIIIDGQAVKPSRLLKANDVVQVKKPPVLYTYRVRGLLGKRLSARLVQDYCENITPASELEKLKVRETFYVVRDRGAGRPTKKERRIIDNLKKDV